MSGGTLPHYFVRAEYARAVEVRPGAPAQRARAQMAAQARGTDPALCGPVRRLSEMGPEERARLEQQLGAPIARGPAKPRPRRSFRRP
jgi:hypothetical protein